MRKIICLESTECVLLSVYLKEDLDLMDLLLKGLFNNSFSILTLGYNYRMI